MTAVQHRMAPFSGKDALTALGVSRVQPEGSVMIHGSLHLPLSPSSAIAIS